MGDGEALLGMPDIELLDILNINCNTIGAEKYKKGVNCNANKYSTIDAGSEQYTQAQKGAVQRQTAMQTATQT